MLYIPCLIYMFIRFSEVEISGSVIWSGLTIVDVFVTHFIIQASYLSCNKKHMESLFNSCSCVKNKVTVRYASNVESTTMGTN